MDCTGEGGNLYIQKSELWLLQVLLSEQFVYILQESPMLLMP